MVGAARPRVWQTPPLMVLADAAFVYRFDLGDVCVWIECDHETCYAYLDGPGSGAKGDCWLFNLVDAPEVFRPVHGEPPLLDSAHARPFDLDRSLDPARFIVTGGVDEGFRTYEIWYSHRLIAVLSSERGQNRSIYATVPSALVQPLDRATELSRYYARSRNILSQVLDLERGRVPEESERVWRAYIEQNEFGLVLDDLREDEARLLPESLALVETLLLVRGEEAA